jgi:tRNA (guanine26-N2/guanine27-N2)-dimethyltransferase
LPDTADAFLNPVQEFNRDLSVACIKTWSEQFNELRRLKWEKKRSREAPKRTLTGPEAEVENDEESIAKRMKSGLKNDNLGGNAEMLVSGLSGAASPVSKGFPAEATHPESTGCLQMDGVDQSGGNPSRPEEVSPFVPRILVG